jgi:hypothetical protein
MRNRLYTTEQVQLGIERFMDDYRASFGTDMEPELRERKIRLVPVVFQCEKCPRYHHPVVRFDGDDPIVASLPDNCACGNSLDRPDVIRDLIGTARLLVETAWARRGLLS